MLKIIFSNYSTDTYIEKTYNFPSKPTAKTYSRFESIENRLVENNVAPYEDYGIEYILNGKSFYLLDDLIDFN